MSTRAQRARVILALEAIANQERPSWPSALPRYLDDPADIDLAERARYESGQYFGDPESWRHYHAEAAQLLREGSVK